MEKFLALPRFPFRHALIEQAPEEPGVYGLFDADGLVFLGVSTPGTTIKTCLLVHKDGARGECTMGATTYTWELSRSPKAREAEILARFHQVHGRGPRCQHAAW